MTNDYIPVLVLLKLKMGKLKKKYCTSVLHAFTTVNAQIKINLEIL